MPPLPMNIRMVWLTTLGDTHATTIDEKIDGMIAYHSVIGTPDDLIARIDSRRPADVGLATALRLYVLADLRQILAARGPAD